MDTKMKVPELIDVPRFLPQSDDYAIVALEQMPRGTAKEVIARCNAAPKLVEALREVRKAHLALREIMLAGPYVPGNPAFQQLEKIWMAYDPHAAILKETGAEK